MSKEEAADHLSQISTHWTTLNQAHSEGDQAARAQLEVLRRYSSAIRRYLLVSVRDADAADELFQEFALRFVRGDFHRVDPKRGKFRNFLKTSLVHLIIDWRRRQARKPSALTRETPEPAIDDEGPSAESDRKFAAVWRADLMMRVWKGLADLEKKTGQLLYSVLRFRTEHPRMRSAEMAEELSKSLGRTVTADWVRKRLFLAREKFTDLLLSEVARSLESPTLDEIESELIDLELLEHCRSALERRRRERGLPARKPPVG